MSEPRYSSETKQDKSLLAEYRDQMLRKKFLAQDEQAEGQIEEMIELIDDLEALFDSG